MSGHKTCTLLVNAAIIFEYLDQQPSLPLAALGHFLTAQKLSILDIKQKENKAIQMLYDISARALRDEAASEEAKQDATESNCTKTSQQLNSAMSFLLEDVPSPSA